ncbi:MAG: hypothetical protein Kow00129_08070 [Thermoleophilia bacterium]
MTERAPSWRNEATLRSAEWFIDYDPSPYIAHISPTPLLLVVAAGDTIVPPDIALKAFNRDALEPKKAMVIPGRHFDIYSGEGFAQSSRAEAEWFGEWL